MAELLGEFSYEVRVRHGMRAMRRNARRACWFTLPLAAFAIAAAVLLSLGEGHWVFVVGLTVGVVYWLRSLRAWLYARRFWQARAGRRITVHLFNDAVAFEDAESLHRAAWTLVSDLRCYRDVWLFTFAYPPLVQVVPTESIPGNLRSQVIERARLAGAQLSGPIARELKPTAAMEPPRRWRMHNAAIAAEIAKEEAAARGKPAREYVNQLLGPLMTPALLVGEPFALLCVLPWVYLLPFAIGQSTSAPSFWYLAALVVWLNALLAGVYWREFIRALPRRTVDLHALLMALAAMLVPAVAWFLATSP